MKVKLTLDLRKRIIKALTSGEWDTNEFRHTPLEIPNGKPIPGRTENEVKENCIKLFVGLEENLCYKETE